MRSLFLLLLLPFITTSALAANITQVTFTSPTPTITNTQIANLGGIKSIYTAGSYAWATDSVNLANAAFYNGKKWYAGVTLPGVTTINGIYPAYPVTGKTGEAWANVVTSSGLAISYFDGANWHDPELIADILKITQPSSYRTSIVTSGGAVVVLAMPSTAAYSTYYSIKTSGSSSWSQPQSVLGVFSPNYFDLFDDNNPVLHFSIYNPQNQTGYLYALPLIGASAGKAVIESGAVFPMVLPTALADGPNIFLAYDVSDSSGVLNHRMFEFKNFNTPNNWQQVPNYIGATITTANVTADNENNGFMCEAIHSNGFVTPPSISFACLDTRTAGNYWLPLQLAIDQIASGTEYQLLARTDGAWVSANQGWEATTTRTLVYDYDQATQSLINTQFPATPFPEYETTNITQVGATGLLACHGTEVIQPQITPAPIKLYYYDRQNNLGWQSLNVGNTALISCGISAVGTPSHSLHRVNSGGTVWLFDNAVS